MFCYMCWNLFSWLHFGHLMNTCGTNPKMRMTKTSSNDKSKWKVSKLIKYLFNGLTSIMKSHEVGNAHIY
jgi:hypothetical protein